MGSTFSKPRPRRVFPYQQQQESSESVYQIHWSDCIVWASKSPFQSQKPVSAFSTSGNAPGPCAAECSDEQHSNKDSKQDTAEAQANEFSREGPILTRHSAPFSRQLSLQLPGSPSGEFLESHSKEAQLPFQSLRAKDNFNGELQFECTETESLSSIHLSIASWSNYRPKDSLNPGHCTAILDTMDALSTRGRYRIDGGDCSSCGTSSLSLDGMLPSRLNLKDGTVMSHGPDVPPREQMDCRMCEYEPLFSGIAVAADLRRGEVHELLRQ
ncbi:hypothetical protein BJ741DRAFT_592967 [Chytriomyces cf. hyalinus JEL632]|nr:hypothetical protein BJ741DRAFT_592967 [Chytriomyces cf. hyalinus JEL632]